jgi:hypothetical protein
MQTRVGPLGWRVAALVTACLVACLAACGSSDKEGGGLLHGKSAKDKKPAAVAADPTADMSAAVSAVKGPSPVTVKFQMPDRPQPGQPLAVEFVLIPDASVQSLAAKFEGDEGLAVVSGDQVPAVEKPAANVPIRHTVTVLPKSDGVYTVTATLTVATEEETKGRVYSIPLIAGNGLPQLASHAEPTRPSKARP